MPSCFGGASGAEQQEAAQTSSLAQMMGANYQKLFGEQSQQFQTLNNILSPLAYGTQQTVTPAVAAAENTAAIDTTGANYANAARAVNNQLAGRGGDSGLESGVDQQIKATIASQGAGQLSALENQNLLNNANINIAGQQRAQAGLQALANAENPNATGQSALAGTGQAFNQANTINTQQNQELANELNFGVSTALDAATFGAGAAGGGGFTGGMQALGGGGFGGGGGGSSQLPAALQYFNT